MKNNLPHNLIRSSTTPPNPNSLSEALKHSRPDAEIEAIMPATNINAKDSKGETPLHKAVAKDDNSLTVRDLLDDGADVNAKNHNGDTPLHKAAAISGNAETVRVLIEFRADVNAKNEIGETPLLKAAAKGRDPKVLDLLLDAGANVNEMDEGGRTALHVVAGSFSNRPHAVFASRPIEENPDRDDFIKRLIEAGGDVSAKDNKRRTPLHEIVEVITDPSIVELLLDKGADVNAKDKNAVTPLHCATQFNTSHAVFALLIKRGAHRSAIDNAGKTPHTVAKPGYHDMLHYAAGGKTQSCTEQAQASRVKPISHSTRTGHDTLNDGRGSL